MHLRFFLFLTWIAELWAQIILVPGAPISATVPQHVTNYYYVSTDGQTTNTLTITCTPLGDGDPDLYVDLNNPQPNSSAPYRARAYGDDAVSIPPSVYAGKPKVYVGVYGYRSSSYTILASFESVVSLIEGIPQAGSVPHEATDYFTLDLTTHGDLTVSATPLQGDLALYISTTMFPVPSDPLSYQYSSNAQYAGEAITIPSSHFPASGHFYIGVYGVTNSSYSIVAAGYWTSIQLRDGIPQSDTCAIGQYKYFFVAVDNSGCTLGVTVTPLSGDPDLYISTTNQYPNTTIFDYVARASGADVITILNAQVEHYYIGVYAYRNTSFTVLANLDCPDDDGQPIYLINGVPQQNAINVTQEKYYKFHVQDNHVDVTITLSRRYGNPDLYVRNDQTKPTPYNYTWASTIFGEDLLTIDVNDANWCTNCDYFIGVYAASNTSYTITAVTSTHTIRLQEGVPLREDLVKGQYEYFRFDVDSVSEELTVSVTPLGSGDPDLYISTSASPNRTSFMWSAQSLYGDSITIPHTDLGACQLCTYWISVYAYSNTSFTIVATFNSSVRLQDGLPQSGSVLKGAFAYYELQTNGQASVTVTLSTLSGSSSLYISSNGSYPETTSYRWYQPYYNQLKSITIAPTDPYACTWSGCSYEIGVYGVQDSTYTIVASIAGGDGGTITLISGVAQRDHVDTGLWEYFSIQVTETGMDLSIIVTPISGDPDLYVSTSNSRPNTTSYDQKAIRWGSDRINYTNARVAIYYIGVNAWTNSTFNILAVITSHNTSCNDLSCAVPLYDGQPQEGVVAQGFYQYYAFNVTSGTTTTLTVTLTVEYGDPDLYITANSTFPTRSNYQWASTRTSSDVIAISHPAVGRYIIGVYGFQAAGYTLTAATSSGGQGNLITLQNGIPVRGQGSQGQYVYYVLPVDSADRDFTVTVTPFSGDPDLYVATNNSHPNATYHQWAAVAYRGDSITVPFTSPDFCRCSFYISVYCYSNASYTLVASFTDTQSLEDGVPQAGNVALRAFRYYRLRIAATHEDLTIGLTPQDGNPDLYVSLNYEPTLYNYTWRQIDQYSTSVLVIRGTDPLLIPDSTGNYLYYLGIYGAEASNFTLVATTSTQTNSLQNGIPVRDWVDANTFEYFSFAVNNAGQDVTIVVTPLSGDPDLYVSNITTRPSLSNYTYAARAIGSDAVPISSSPTTTWYIGVYGFSQNSSFTITASIHCPENCPPIMLVNGVPQSGYLNARDYQYYSFSGVTNTTSKLSITVTRSVGDPDIYVRNDGNQPNSSYWLWSSTAFGQDLITIQNPPAGEYDVGIYAYSTTQYTVLVSTEKASTTLSDGIPIREDLQQGQYEYFLIRVDRNDVDLTITVTSFNGDPDLFVSAVYTHPNEVNFTWSARSLREDSITIPVSSLQLTTYYISVLAYTNCTFTITAGFNNETLLQDGTPQSGTVAFEVSVYYKFNVNQNHTDITFSLNPYTGNAYLYISTITQPIRGNITSYQWSSVLTTTGQVITIYRTDPNFCSFCTYYVMVYGHQASNYSLIASTATSTNTLQEGVPQRSSVATGEYSYFIFSLRLQTADLRVTVTPIAGDPDLYISATIEKPTSTNYTWKGEEYGADAIDIPYTDLNYVSGLYYISVYGWRNSTFTILATVQDLNGTTCGTDSCPTVLLQNGVPQVGFLDSQDDYQYYEFYPSTSADVTFTVSPTYGDPDLYIRNDGLRPNSTFYQWMATNYGRDSVTVPQACNASCRFIVQVNAWSRTLYSVVASTTEGTTLLQNGVGIVTYLNQNHYKWFSVLVEQDNSTDPLIVSATAISGDPDLYISNGSNTHPNASSYMWVSFSYGSDQVVIPNPVAGFYYIGAFGYRNTTFTLLATNGPIVLANGEPHSDSLDRGQYRMYKIAVSYPSKTDLIIALNVNQGDPVMYIGNSMLNESQPDPVVAGSYKWSTADAAQSNQRYMITILSTDVKACFNCTYYIRVVANTTLSSFSITGSYGTESILLSSGKPFSTTVRQGSYVYFRGISDVADRDLNFGVTTFMGDTDLYVSKNSSNPKKDNSSTFQWFSIHDPSARGDYVSISHLSQDFTTGVYYIGVYGWQDSQFTITIATDEILLAPGTSQVGVLSMNGTAYFFLNVSDPTDVSLSISAFNDSVATSSYMVYVTTNSSVTQPGPNQYDWVAPLKEGGDALFIPRTEGCGSCTYYVGVYGSPGKKFTILGSIEGVPDSLFSGKAVSGSVSEDGMKYYQIYVSVANNFTVLVETCQGNADLYIARVYYKPTKNQYGYESENDKSNDLQIIKDPSITDSEFYIGVYGQAKGVTNYIVTAWTDGNTPAKGPDVGSGSITVKSESGTLELQFYPAISSFPPDALAYTVYWSSNNTVMYSLCGLDSATSDLLNFNDPVGDTMLSYIFKDGRLVNDVVYKFNIMVQDPAGRKSLYTQTTGSLGNDDGGGVPIKIILGVSLPIGSILVLLIVYLCVRNRNLTRQLDIEIQDLPKAAIPGPQRERYSRLIVSEDDPSSDNYVPPDTAAPPAL